MPTKELFSYKESKQQYQKRKWTDVESSHIARMDYSAKFNQLYVQFKNQVRGQKPGSILVYVYWNVTLSDVKKLGFRYDEEEKKLVRTDNQSVGERLNSVIKARKDYARLEYV